MRDGAQLITGSPESQHVIPRQRAHAVTGLPEGQHITPRVNIRRVWAMDPATAKTVAVVVGNARVETRQTRRGQTHDKVLAVTDLEEREYASELDVVDVMGPGDVLVEERTQAGYDPTGYGERFRGAVFAKGIVLHTVSQKSVANERKWDAREGRPAAKADMLDAHKIMLLYAQNRSRRWAPHKKHALNLHKGTPLNSIFVVARRQKYDEDEVGRLVIPILKAAKIPLEPNKPLRVKAAYLAYVTASREFTAGFEFGYRTYRRLLGDYELARGNQARASLYHDAVEGRAEAMALADGRHYHAKKGTSFRENGEPWLIGSPNRADIKAAEREMNKVTYAIWLAVRDHVKGEHPDTDAPGVGTLLLA
jgi:hypothetical protein